MPTATVLGTAAIVGFGMLEGVAFTAAGLASPIAMKEQMTFKGFAILKMFLSALGSSMVAQSLLDMNGTTFEKTRHYSRRVLRPSVVATGCAILGVGMYLAGSGPTMMPSQLAVGIPSAPAILAGAFAGGVTFSLIEKYLPSHGCAAPTQPLDHFKGYSKIAIPLGVAMIGASFGLEKAFPSSGEWSKTLASGASSAIIPTLAGLILGLNQIPLRLIAGRGQGGSTSVLNILSTCTGGLIQPKHRLTNLFDALPTIYVYPATFLGALLTMKMLPITYAPVEQSQLEAFVGGFLMLLGARIADGCTCGHGITGCSELMPTSFLGAACIFGGGMAAAALGLKL